jgi:hypothetical protein
MTARAVPTADTAERSRTQHERVPARDRLGPLVSSWGSRTVEVLVDHRLLCAVLLAFAASALVVPTMAPVAISDDWVYTRSVEILLAEGRLEILGVSAANAVFQVFWAAPFVAIAGEVFAGVRLATVVFVGLSAVPLYAWCRELAVPRPLSAIAAAAYLFNPMAYVLSFTCASPQAHPARPAAARFRFRRTDLPAAAAGHLPPAVGDRVPSPRAPLALRPVIVGHRRTDRGPPIGRRRCARGVERRGEP